MRPARKAGGGKRRLLPIGLCFVVSGCHLLIPYSSSGRPEIDAEIKLESGTADSGLKIADSSAVDSAAVVLDAGVNDLGTADVERCAGLANGTTCGSGMVCNAGSCQRGCWISSAFYGPGATKAGNTCQSCQPTTSASQWSNAAIHTACGSGHQCIGGACLINPMTFEYKGQAQLYEVPAGVTSLAVEAWGASGSGDSGGKGGYVKATLAVSPGTVLQLNVGGQGKVVSVADGQPVFPGAGGWNGGGSGGGTDHDCTVYGAGGASDVRSGAYALTERIIVAGGGGGQGSSGAGLTAWGCGTPGAGGHGGFEAGSGGAGSGSGYASLQGTPGGGATSSQPGGPGLPGQYYVPPPDDMTYSGYRGTVGALGAGADGPGAWYCGSGGGGGGFYGGGSGGAPSANGGGGGSSWVASSAIDITYATGVRMGDGKIVVAW